MRQRAGGGKLNRGHNFHRLSRGPSVQHHSNCLNASPSCCQAGCLVMVSAFCVQQKGFLALHHLSMHRLHPECNSSDFLQQLHTWGNCVKNVHLLHTRKLKALIWNGTTKVTNPTVISTQIRDRQTQTGTLLSAVDFLRLQQHHRLFKRIKSRRSAWSLATRWYKTVNYSCRFHKSAFVSESLHSENQGYNLTKQCSSQWQLVVVRQRQEPTKAAGKIDCSQVNMDVNNVGFTIFQQMEENAFGTFLQWSGIESVFVLRVQMCRRYAVSLQSWQLATRSAAAAFLFNKSQSSA